MDFYENIRAVAKEKGYSINRLEAEIGFPRGAIHKWEYTNPGADKLMAISDFLGVSVDELCHGKKSYYKDANASTMAQEAFDSPEMKLLFDAARGSSAEDILFAREVLLKLKRGSGND